MNASLKKYTALITLILIIYSCESKRVEKQDFKITYARVGNVYPGDDIKITKDNLSNFRCVPSSDNWGDESSGLNEYDFYDDENKVLHISTIQGKVFEIAVYSNEFRTDNNMMVGQTMEQLENVKRNITWYYEDNPSKMPIRISRHNKHFNDSCFYFTFENPQKEYSRIYNQNKLIEIVIR